MEDRVNRIFSSAVEQDQDSSLLHLSFPLFKRISEDQAYAENWELSPSKDTRITVTVS